MLDLAGADAVGQGPEGAVGGGVAVAADDGHARLGAALLGPDHVDDAVARIAHGEEFDAGVGDVARQGLQLQPRLVVGDGVDALGLALGRHIVVGDRQGQVGPAHRPMAGAQAGEGLRAWSPHGSGAGRCRGWSRRSASWPTTWASQILSYRVLPAMAGM